MEEKLSLLEESVLVPNCEHIWSEVFEPIDSKHVEKLMAKLVGVTDRPLRSLLEHSQGFKFEWRWSDPEWEGLNASGQIRFPGVYRLLNGDPENAMPAYGKGYCDYLWTKSKRRGWDEKYDQYLMIDDLGLGNAVLLDIELGILYLWLFNTGAFALTLQLDAYFETAFHYRGLYLWQGFHLASGLRLPENLVLAHHFQVSRLFPELAASIAPDPIPAYLEISRIRNYASRFEPIYDRLFGKKAKIRDSASNHGCPIQSLNKIIQTHDLNIPAEMLALFMTIGSQRYDWEIDLKNGQKAGGDFFLYGLEDMFGGPEDQRSKNVHWDYCTFKQMNFGKDEAKDPDYKPFFEKRTLYWDPNCQILLSTENGKLRLELMRDVDELYDLDIPFEVIIDRLVDCAGLQSWVHQIRKEEPPVKLVPFEAPLREIFPEVAENGFYFHS